MHPFRKQMKGKVRCMAQEEKRETIRTIQSSV